MKTSIILFLLICLIRLAYCQHQWAPTGARWYYNGSKAGPMDKSFIIGESVGDTLVQGKNCKTIVYKKYYNGYYSNFGKPEIIYNDSNKVYHFDKNLNEFYTLYDFSLSKGDTFVIRDSPFFGVLHLEGQEFNRFEAIIFDKDTIWINEKPLRRLITLYTSDTDFSLGSIIEYIGSEGLFFGLEMMVPLNYQGNGGLRCYEDSMIQYKRYTDCEDMVTGINNFNKYNNSISIYPVPANNTLYVSNLPQNAKVKIYNLKGELMENLITEGVDLILDTGNYIPGKYLIIIQAGSSSVYKSFVKL